MELKVITNPLDGTGPAKRLLSNLFYGCGYNFYRREHRLRADDRLIRRKLRQLLRESRAHLNSHLIAWAHVASATAALQCAQRELEAMELAILTSALPQVDRLHRRHQEERGALEKLVALDGEALLALVTLRDAIARLDDGAPATIGMRQLLRASEFSALWNRREAMLVGDSA
jgi:hypothetical protein